MTKKQLTRHFSHETSHTLDTLERTNAWSGKETSIFGIRIHRQHQQTCYNL